MMMQSLMQLGFLTYYSLNVESIEAEYCVNKDKPEMCCKGKCYISKQLGQTSSEAPASKTNSENSVPDFIVSNPHSIVYNNGYVFKLYPVYPQMMGANYADAQYRPPRCSSSGC